jgi:hypothetical protein
MRRLALMIGVLFLSSAIAPVRAELIDSFETAQSLSVNITTNFAEGTVSGSGILFGKRYVALEKISGGVGASVYVNIDSAGLMDFNQDSRVKSKALLVWDGNGHEGENPFVINTSSSIDLTDGGTSNCLAIDVVNDDLPINVQMTLYGVSQSASTMLSLPGGVASTTYYVLFSAFAGIDPTNVRAITLQIDGTQTEGADLTLDNFRSTSTSDVPEPATWLLIGLALAGIGAFRRK